MSATAEDFYKDKKLTVEEYFALEEELNQKFEYVDGEIFDMTGGTINHSLISTNTVALLHRLLHDTPCTVLNSDAKLQLETVSNYFYPDAMVLCDQGEMEKKYVLHPQIIIEVLSPSTEDYDHGKKFAFYRQIEALQTYILLHQDQAFAEVFQRNPDNSWVLKEYAGLESSIPVDKELSLAMADLYRRVDFDLGKY
jgi:Uma2 family endonuclease